MSKSVIPNVVILGRPNVGKSALFNRLISRRKALVDATSGVTRDYISNVLEWNGVQFMLSDSAGVTFLDDDFQIKVFTQIKKAIEIADVILFAVDFNITPLDHEVSSLIRQSGKKTLLVVNKVDSISQEWNNTDPFNLGWEDVFKVSAISGLGTGDLLDAIVNLLPKSSKRIEESTISLAIVGRPNVGKSTLLNNILGDQRVIVDDKPGTTRDAVDAMFRFEGRTIKISDTAGILKRQQGLDYYSSLRSFDAIKHSDVVLLLVDCLQGIGKIEKVIAGETIKEYKGIVILVNKWDAYADKEGKAAEKFKEKLFDDLPF
jgi:GTP-binding protein